MNADVCDRLIVGITELVTPTHNGPSHGPQMRELSIEKSAALAITNGSITWAGPAREWRGTARETVDLGERAVVPGLVDPHTHAVWAGDRLRDFEARTSGVSYEQILAAGGGIRSTVAATLAATDDQLLASAEERVQALLRSGATVVEVKSGYGLSIEGELRLLEVIARLAHRAPVRIIPTLLLHIPPSDASELERYMRRVEMELVPEAARRKLATAVDIFVEREAWSAAQAERLLGCALDHELKVKMHAEQFHSVGGLELAMRLGALSVDHLEAMSSRQLSQFGAAATIATVLPGVSLHLGIPAAPGRALIDAGAAVAVGTDLNPGSSPLYSINAALALAVRLNGLTPAEALVAGTTNAARAAGLSDAGSIAVGSSADFVVLQSHDWRDLVYTTGTSPVREVWRAGERMHTSRRDEAA